MNGTFQSPIAVNHSKVPRRHRSAASGKLNHLPGLHALQHITPLVLKTKQPN